MPADGNIFACKSGTVEKQSGSSRRVLFGFPGWTQRTKPPKAPKCLNLPREMTLDDGQMRLAPVHEMTTLRRGSASGEALASGSQVEVRLSCGWAASSSAKTRLRTWAVAPQLWAMARSRRWRPRR